MAPFAGSPTKRSQNNGHRNGGYKIQDAPPSTLAANLANNLSTNRRSSRNDDHEDFQRLLLEVSTHGGDQNGASSMRAVIEHHHKLIYVVAKAVLDVLTRNYHLFNDQLIQQASEGLDILIATIKETPEVLDHVAGEAAQLQSGSNVPLWLWLFPRVLALVGRPGCEMLRDKITEFFKICFAAASRSLQLWALNSSFFYYLSHCTETALNRLHRSKVTASGQLPVLELVLPLASVKDNIEVQDSLDLTSEGCTYAFHDVQHALRHAYYLLVLIVDISSSTANTYDATPEFQAHLAWILDSFLLLQDAKNAWGSYSATQESEFELCVISMRAVHSLLISLDNIMSITVKEKGYRILAYLCAELVEHSGALYEITVRKAFCSALLEVAAISMRHETVSQAVESVLMPALWNSLDVELDPGLSSTDIQQYIDLLLRPHQSESFTSENTLPNSADLETFSLAAQIQYLGLEQDFAGEVNGTRPSKRRKLAPKHEVLGEIVREVYLLLGSQNASDLDGLSQIAPACFSQLNNTERSRAMEYMGYVSCASAGCLVVFHDRDGNICDVRCFLCDSGDLDVPATYDENVATEAITTFTNLVTMSGFEESVRPRVLGMLALRRFATHFENNIFLDLETSKLGQWCLKSLRSSVRELRIAAGRTLSTFLRGNIEEDVLRKNRINVLDFLRVLSDQNVEHLTETCILAWGQVGRISKDRELNLVLLRLVEYLGHTNQIASGVAFNEILNLSKSFSIPISQMLKPYWRSIGPTVVKDLQSRPQTAQLMADLLEISVTELLLNIQADVLPWLVLVRKKDVILRIAQACNDDDPGTTCLQASNIGPILALLLIQNVPDLEMFTLKVLREISPLFDGFEFVDLIRSGPMYIAIELLKNAGEEDDNRRSRVRHALAFLASRAVNGVVESSYSRRGNQVGPFLEMHILPIIFNFSNLLKYNQGWQCLAEKRRSLMGIEEMIRVGKGYIRSALPQICACLQSALATNEIRSTAFSAWKTMIKSLDDEDIGPMLETTFATIILSWKAFDNASRVNAIELINHILKQRTDLIRDFIDVIPSLDQITDLVEYEKELKKMRADLGDRQRYRIFSRRVGHEHETVVTQALIELRTYLRQHQAFLQTSALSEQPDSVVGELLRSILDACVRFSGKNHEIARLSAESIGLIGCLDSNRVEAIRDRKEIVVISNFDDPGDSTDFVLFVLEEVIVKAFLSTKDPRTQAFLSYAMQKLLEKSNIKGACMRSKESGDRDEPDDIYLKWLSLPEAVRQTLTPFLRSSYTLVEMAKVQTKYPIFEPGKKYTAWLRSFVLDLLRLPCNENAMIIFEPLCRVIRIEDTSIANFLLPYVVLHVVVLGTDLQRENIQMELLRVLSYEPTTDSHFERTNLKLCSEAIFRILDYISRWAQEKKAKVGQSRGHDAKWSHSDGEISLPELGIQRVEVLQSSIPAEVISRRAVECNSFSRALFHWEQHIRQVREDASRKDETTKLLERLQAIYTQIDEPDGIEGIAAHLHVLDIDQQILGHRKAGRWTAAQSWYEIKLAEEPDNIDVQVSLLHCLKESGQHDVLLNYVEGMHKTSSALPKLLPFAAEASWTTGRWDSLQKYISNAPQEQGEDFDVSIGRTLLALHRKDTASFTSTISIIREQIACSLSWSMTSSLGICHDVMLKFHVLTELEMIADPNEMRRKHILESLDRRLETIGAYLNDKQYLLGIRRAAMQLTSPTFTKGDIASAWLTSAKLARKGNSLRQSFNAVLHASQLGDESATIEHARLLWKEGQHRKAIQSLQGAIDTNAFISHNRGPADDDSTSFTAEDSVEQQNLLTARAHLLLAKWLDTAGHTHSSALRSQYQLAAKMHSTWEKGHYYLGRHYNKLLESEKGLPLEQQAQAYLIGDTARLVIENYLRSLSYGTKYIYQTLPRVLTLWLDLGSHVNQPVDSKYGTREFISKISACRREQLNMLHNRFTKYIQKMPAYIFYTALPQIVARIAHPNNEVYQYLQQIIVKVVSAHPQQALWTLLAVSTSTQQDRKTRGLTILAALRNIPKKAEIGGHDLRSMIKSGEKLANQLLMVCNAGDFQGNRTITASITRDLGFNNKLCIPSPLCVPIESALTATLPTLTDSIRSHKAFSRDVVTVSQFLDEVLVLSSLQKPRKLTARGSDGRSYGLLCKPKDDLRKDQRLMEFNSMINRSLKRDADSSKRQLYIKTYAVTPLNEECGIIEWVDGLKTLRDILLNLYKLRGITPNYSEIKMYLDEACKGDDKLSYFNEKILRNYPPVFHSWFVQQFPEPSAWFVARLKYTRSCAVMSMVGTVLGLGDRHGENILFEEGNGGTFHVDFNCLFDKGLTFAQPERVPFRLTHNMVDAMGVYGYEGPFRKSSELTLKLLRQHEETLMTILEAFVYDPTLDLLARKNEKRKKEREGLGVPETAQGVLDSIRRKVRGLLAGESVPLGVEGQVDELIKQAVSEKNLAAMYIGWCAFF